MKYRWSVILGIFFSFSVQASDYNGLWKTECFEDPYTGQFTLSRVQFEDTIVELFVEFYEDANCALQSNTVRSVFEYVIGQELSSVSQAFEIDLKMTGYFETANSKDFVSLLNRYEYFGFNDWQLNTEKELTGLSWNGQTAPKAGDELFSLVQLQNDQLFFGLINQAHNGLAVEHRPDEIDYTITYQRN